MFLMVLEVILYSLMIVVLTVLTCRLGLKRVKILQPEVSLQKRFGQLIRGLDNKQSSVISSNNLINELSSLLLSRMASKQLEAVV